MPGVSHVKRSDRRGTDIDRFKEQCTTSTFLMQCSMHVTR